MKRRTVLKVISGSVALIGCRPGEEAGECGDALGFVPGEAPVVRKGASQMRADEIERFTQAWQLLVENGELDQLAIGHADIDNQRHHGTQIRGDYTGFVNPDNYAHRFLCWHRAYVTDLEQAMRKALVADYAARGLDCALADTVFVPYLDGEGYPQWVRDWMPTGTPTGVFVQHIDPTIDPDNGHESNGLELGDTYEVVVRAYHGQSHTCSTVPPSARVIQECLAHESFVDMSVALESTPGLIHDVPDPDLANTVRMVADTIVDKDGQNAMVFMSFLFIADIIETGGWPDPEQKVFVMPAITALDRGRAFDEYGIQGWSDEQFFGVLEAVNAYVQRSPHAILHFYSAGESTEAGVRGLYGSSAYFQDAGADPHFYMLHCELDRYFETWLQSNSDTPPLEGEDRLFKTWPGAREWTVEQLMDASALPFVYDELWSPG